MSSQETVVVDGSFGEGGGQILRTSVALSAVLQRPLEVLSIRAKRDNPGLRPQHVAAIKAVAEICDAEVTNLTVGSNRINFVPGNIRTTKLSLDIGTAGSITLLLQPVILASSLSGVDLELEIKGGTDVKWSPTMNYFTNVVLSAFKLMGINVQVKVPKRGYYPQGGGLVQTKIMSSTQIQSLRLTNSPPLLPIVLSVCSNLPRSVAERQLSSAVNHLFNEEIKVERTDISIEDAMSPGSSIVIYSVGENGPFVGADSIGERGKPAESVGKEAARHFAKEFKSNAPVDFHLADMLVPFLALAQGESLFRTSAMSQHLMTNLHVSQLFTGCSYSVDEQLDGTFLVRIHRYAEKTS